MEDRTTQESILKTLCYGDIFKFPMTASEIHKYLISDKEISQKYINKELDKMVKRKIINSKNKYYYLFNQNQLVEERKKRTLESGRKMARARKIAQILRFIPSISAIGISGSLAMDNSTKSDDIDFFIITKENTIWFTRLMVHVTLFVFRRINKKNFGKEKICPNMYLPENNLQIPISKRNLFTAHEASQLKIVFDKNESYKKFMLVNPWVLKYLPNSFSLDKILFFEKRSHIFSLMIFINKFFYLFQYLYMKRHIRHEEVTEESIRFHNKNKSNYVMDLFTIKYKFFEKKHTKTNSKLPIGNITGKSANTPGY